MGNKTKIQWTAKKEADGTLSEGATWNFLRGCSLVSSGCLNCYAMYTAARFNGPGQWGEGLAKKRSNGMAQWTGVVKFVPEKLSDPLRWTKPRRIFTNSISDLFHETVPFEIVAAAFGVMAATPQHQHQVLTKRPERMLAFFEWLENLPKVKSARERADLDWRINVCTEFAAPHLSNWMPKLNETEKAYKLRTLALENPWPLANVWMGVSVESQPYAHRAHTLQKVPAAIRFVSAEPLLGPVDFTRVQIKEEGKEFPTLYNTLKGSNGIDWIIAGAESGTPERSRPMDPNWVRQIRDQCKIFDTAFFYKQDAKNGKKIGTPFLDGERWMQMPDEDIEPVADAQGSLGL